MNALKEGPMSETQSHLRTMGGLAIIVVLLFLTTLALTGCDFGPAVIAAVEPTATLYPAPPTDIPVPPPGPTPEALDFPLEPPNHVELDIPDDRDCVNCHTSEETLRAMAEEEEGDQESLSEGEG
jgi:hypothetical protein